MSTMHDETKTIICKKCGYENSLQSKFCPNCGEKVVREDICANCGTKIDPSLKFCQECGAKTLLCIAEERAEAERKAQAEAESIAKEKKEKCRAFFTFFKKYTLLLLSSLLIGFLCKRVYNNKLMHNATRDIIGNMVCIPDSAVHKGLYFGKYEVTQAQWQSIMGDNPSEFTGDSSRPVEKVSWYDCQKFIEKLNAREEVKQAGLTFFLPTSEQWEYACRVGSTGYYGLLADGRVGSLDEMGWYGFNSGNKTHPVGLKKPNAWGLYDMHGNVCEWTASEYSYLRICRGGSWDSSAENCVADYWSYDFPVSRNYYLGFRLAASRTGK